MLWSKRRCSEMKAFWNEDIFPCFYETGGTALPVSFYFTLTSTLISSLFLRETAQLKTFSCNVQMLSLPWQTHLSCHFPQEPLPFHFKEVVAGGTLHCTWRPLSSILVLFIVFSCSWLIPTSVSVAAVLCSTHYSLLHQQVLPCWWRKKKILQAPRNDTSWRCLIVLSFSADQGN